MNRFAHSVDDPLKEIAVAESLEVLLAICRRLTDARGLAVTITPLLPEVPIVTRPFYFYHLVWLLLEWCMQCEGPPGRLELRIEQAPASVHLVFKRFAKLNPEVWEGFPNGEIRDLLALLGADLELKMDRHEVTALLPKTIGA